MSFLDITNKASDDLNKKKPKIINYKNKFKIYQWNNLSQKISNNSSYTKNYVITEK